MRLTGRTAVAFGVWLALLATAQPAEDAADGAGRQTAAVVDRLVDAAREAETARAQAVAKPLEDAGIRLGPWYSIGPFKDAEYGLFSRSFEKPLGPEADVLTLGSEPADLEKTYHSVPLVGMSETGRRWRVPGR